MFYIGIILAALIFGETPHKFVGGFFLVFGTPLAGTIYRHIDFKSLFNKVKQICISGLILLAIIFPLAITLVLYAPILIIVFANSAFDFMYSKYIKKIENARSNSIRESPAIYYILSVIVCLGVLSGLIWFATICLTATINNLEFSLPIVGSVSTVLLSRRLIGDQ
jgi:uncharacterized membrane protein